MRTNIVIDDKLMADAMAAGGFKTKREAVEEGLRLIKRRKAYAALLAARGTLHWDDSDEAWAKSRQEQREGAANAVHEPEAKYAVAQDTKP
jgi:antitoxin ParD1/3/4